MPRPLKRRPRRPERATPRPTPTTDRGAAAAHVPELLASADGDVLGRLVELGQSTPGGALAIVGALGDSRSEAAGRVLAAVATQTPDKELRKAARRELHRLQAVGVAVEIPATIAPQAGPPRAVADDIRLDEAVATAPSGIGSRVLWLTLERRLGGLLVFTLLINDIAGLRDCVFRDTTRKRHNEMLRDWRDRQQSPVVNLPPEYALALVSEALELNASTGTPVPTEFQIHRHVLGELPPPPAEALIHRHVSRGQALLMPNLLEESAQLLGEDELEGWFFDDDPAIERARELRRMRESRILLSGESREDRERRVVDAAVEALFTPGQRWAIRRRLEEVAWIFWETGRERSAREAVAAAFAIGEGSLVRHPFARALVDKSLEIMIEAEQAGIDPVSLRRSPFDRAD